MPDPTPKVFDMVDKYAEGLMPYVVERKTLHDRVRGTDSNFLVWEKNLKEATKKHGKPIELYDEIKVRRATEEEVGNFAAGEDSDSL